jgi:hypothetical protein
LCTIVEHPPILFSGGLKNVDPTILHNCPYKAGEKLEQNFTFKSADCDTTEIKQKPTFNRGIGTFADGEYKVVLILFDRWGSARLEYFFRMKYGDQRRF